MLYFVLNRILSQSRTLRMAGGACTPAENLYASYLNCFMPIPKHRRVRGCESIVKSHLENIFIVFKLLIFKELPEYKPRFVLQILNTFTVSYASRTLQLNRPLMESVECVPDY
jgi:hypothetical protein